MRSRRFDDLVDSVGNRISQVLRNSVHNRIYYWLAHGGVRFNRVWCSILPCWVFASAVSAAPPNFEEDVRPIFKEHCLSCHNPDKKKAGLDLSSVQAIQVGSSGGEVVKAGGADTSVLYMVMNHHEDFDTMPPKKPKLPEKELNLVHQWIAGGLLVSKDGKSQLREMSFDLTAGSAERPERPAIPTHYPPLKSVESSGPAPVIAMAASPWADLVAVGRYRRISMIGKGQVPSESSGYVPVAEKDLLIRRSFDGASDSPGVKGKMGIAYAAGKASEALPLPEVPVDFLLQNRGFTISMWVKPDLDMESPILFGRPSFTVFLERKKNGWTVRSYHRDTKNATIYHGRISEIEEGKWQHVAVTCDGKEWVFYYGGAEVARQAMPEENRGFLENDAPFLIGGDGNQEARRYRGGLDEFRIYKRALGPAEIGEMVRATEPVFASVGELDFSEGTVHDLRFSPNGELLLAAGGVGAESGALVVYDVETGKRKLELEDGQDVILSADISADHRVIATGAPSKIVKIFSATDGEMLHRIEKHTDWVTVVRFSPDGKLLATADRNGGIHVWETKTGGIVYTLDEHKVKVTALSWRSDGKMLASAGEDGKFVLWDMQDGWPARTAMAHAGDSVSRYSRRTGILDAGFLRDGRLLTVGRDRSMRIHGADGAEISVIEGMSSLPLQAAGSVDGKLAFSGGIDGDLRVWSLDAKTEIQVIPPMQIEPSTSESR